jgi:lysozyme family protein
VNLFDYALNLVLKHEGGYVNDPADPGGETIYGISRRHHPEAWAAGRPSKAQASLIYRRDYWDRLRCDELPAPVAVLLFDTAVNCGNKRAVQFLQRAISVADDGVLGSVTIGRCRTMDAHTIAQQLADQRMAHYRALSTFGRFGKGWSNRVDDVLEEIRELDGVA